MDCRPHDEKESELGILLVEIIEVEKLNVFSLPPHYTQRI